MTTPAAHTRKEAIVKGGKDRRPIFAVIKLTAQITTTTPISKAMTRRRGARPLEDSTSTASDQPFFPHCKLLDSLAPRLKTNPRPSQHANRPLRRHRHFRLDDVFIPITPARRHIARQSKIREGRKRNIVRAPDSRFEHSPTPYRHSILLAQVMYPPRHGMPANASHLDIDNLAGTQSDCRLRVLL